MFGERIRQARLLAGMSQEQLVNKLLERNYKITKQAISKYEKNKSTAPAQFLLLASSILGVPTSYFSHEPKVEMQWLAFRKHSQLATADQVAIKSYASDVAELQMELQNLLYPHAEVQLPPVRSVRTFEEAEQMAWELRRVWGLGDRPIDSLVRTAEKHYVVVVAWHKGQGKFDGLSGWCGQHPVTVMNTEVDIDRRRFTLAHELGHLLMDTDTSEAEELANRFAGAFLVTSQSAIYELGNRRTRIDWEEFGILKRKYGLSIGGWIHRARDLGIITEHYARQLLIQRSQMGWRKQEPTEYAYKGDEQPLLLDQMAHHASSEGLMNSDRIRRVYPTWKGQEVSPKTTERFTIYDLLALPYAEQQERMSASVALASTETFEIFDADEVYDYGEVEC